MLFSFSCSSYLGMRGTEQKLSLSYGCTAVSFCLILITTLLIHPVHIIRLKYLHYEEETRLRMVVTVMNFFF